MCMRLTIRRKGIYARTHKSKDIHRDYSFHHQGALASAVTNAKQCVRLDGSNASAKRVNDIFCMSLLVEAPQAEHVRLFQLNGHFLGGKSFNC